MWSSARVKDSVVITVNGEKRIWEKKDKAKIFKKLRPRILSTSLSLGDVRSSGSIISRINRILELKCNSMEHATWLGSSSQPPGWAPGGVAFNCQEVGSSRPWNGSKNRPAGRGHSICLSLQMDLIVCQHKATISSCIHLGEADKTSINLQTWEANIYLIKAEPINLLSSSGCTLCCE